MLNTEKKRVLHVGCGPANPEKLPEIFRGEEWQEVRLDIDEKVKPDIVSSMTNMPMVEADSMDALFSSHNVEHLYKHQVHGALQEFHRVIKPGGQVVITLPDIQAVAAYIAEGVLDEPFYNSPGGPIAPVDMLYGWTKAIAEGNHYMAHKTGFSAKTLAKHMLAAGFSNIIVRRRWLDLWATGLKLPEGHEQRKMQAQIVNQRLHGPKGERLPVWYERLLQMQSDLQKNSDELEVAPQLWKSPGLRNA